MKACGFRSFKCTCSSMYHDKMYSDLRNPAFYMYMYVDTEGRPPEELAEVSVVEDKDVLPKKRSAGNGEGTCMCSFVCVKEVEDVREVVAIIVLVGKCERPSKKARRGRGWREHDVEQGANRHPSE